MKDFVKLEDISKIYKMGEVEIRAVDGIRLYHREGGIRGNRGSQRCGKDHSVKYSRSGMDTATSEGRSRVDGASYHVLSYSEKKLTGYRRNDIGFVFQFYNLLQNLTASGKCGAGASDLQKSPRRGAGSDRCGTGGTA